MNPTTPRDPIDELRRANPVRTEDLPTTSRDRLWARVEEAHMNDQAIQPRLPKWMITIAGVAAAGTLALGAIQLANPPVSEPVGGGGGGAAGMCIVYSTDLLRERQFAFDGTVTAINGNQATFTVNTAFWGVTASSITLTSDQMTGPIQVAEDGGPQLQVGSRYLVTGDDIFAWACGYTQEYSDAAAAEWAALAP